MQCGLSVSHALRRVRNENKSPSKADLAPRVILVFKVWFVVRTVEIDLKRNTALKLMETMSYEALRSMANPVSELEIH